MRFLSFNIDKELIYQLLLLMCTTSIILILSDSAFAGGLSTNSEQNVIGDRLCAMSRVLSGTIAQGIAIIAVFAVGMSLFLGKLQWTTAAIIVVAMAVIFGAPTIVETISGLGSGQVCPE